MPRSLAFGVLALITVLFGLTMAALASPAPAQVTIDGRTAVVALEDTCTTSKAFAAVVQEQTDEFKLNVVLQGDDARIFLAKDGAPENLVNKTVTVELYTLKLKAPRTTQLLLVVALDSSGCISGHRFVMLKPTPSA